MRLDLYKTEKKIGRKNELKNMLKIANIDPLPDTRIESFRKFNGKIDGSLIFPECQNVFYFGLHLIRCKKVSKFGL